MAYIEEFDEFSGAVKRMAYGLLFSLFLAIFFLTFPSSQSITERIFEKISLDLIPYYAELVSLSIWSSAVSLIQISLVLGLICVLPWFFLTIFRYLSPGLYGRERYILIKIVIPSFILFISGALFAYKFLIPPTFSIMYSFAERLQIKPLIDVGDFVSTVIMLMVASGVIFLLPIGMLALNAMGIVDKTVWETHWRQVLLAFFIFSAVITPDGTGITMLILVTPMILLYIGGWFLSRKY